jgi:molybdate transport system regulatory protein
MPKRAEKSRKTAVRVMARLRVECGGKSALTDAGADLLEQILACESLSEAARRLHYSYRRAWMLLDAMNKAWPHPLVTTATGGKRGGGAKVTQLGKRVLAGYRQLQIELEHFLDVGGRGFSRGLNAS